MLSTKRPLFLACILSLILLSPGWAATRVGVLWSDAAAGPDATDQESFFSLLTALGLNPQKLRTPVPAFHLLCVPHVSASGLNSEQIKGILAHVEKGMVVVTDGSSRLSDALGLNRTPASAVNKARCASDPQMELRWPDNPAVESFGSLPANLKADCVDAVSNQAVSASGFLGKGAVIAFASLFDPISSQGYSRYPDFPIDLIEKMKLSARSSRHDLQAYVDPGFRLGQDPNNVADFWRKSGIGVIYLSAWYTDGAKVDYAKIISAAHRNGIRVYAWLEWPHVSKSFWDQHPEWRERTVTGDAHVDWRYLMNLQNADCKKQALLELKDFLSRYKWDGVNVAEIYYEPVEGPDNPDSFTPLNNDARAMFKKESGIDPIMLFDAKSPFFWKRNPKCLADFYRFRKQQASQVLDEIIATVRSMRGFEQNRAKNIVCTLIDVYSEPQMSDFLGIDIDEQFRIAHRHGTVLQIEDSMFEWSKTPSRYTELNRRYHERLGREKFIIDINVVPTHPKNQIGFPTDKVIGSEVLQLWAHARDSDTTVCFYAESELRPQDWELLNFASNQAAAARYDAFK